MTVDLDISANTVALLFLGALNLATACITWNTRSLTKETALNTNSMKDALVKKTDEAAEARGRDTERAKGEEKAAALVAEAGQGNGSPRP